jgi:hypothetical protein
MSSNRFQQQDRGSFEWDVTYDRVVPADQVLNMLEVLVPLDRFTRKPVRTTTGQTWAAAREGCASGDPLERGPDAEEG